MILFPTGVRVWVAAGHTDMRRGTRGLALRVQEALKRDPHIGDLYVFRGRSGSLIKILWHDGVGMSLYSRRLERGRFIWPSAAAGVVSISSAQLAYMLDGIDWRNPQHTWRPTAAGRVLNKLRLTDSAREFDLTNRCVHAAIPLMVEGVDHLSDDAAALKAALIEARAKLSGAEALIEHLQLVIAKMKRAMFGPRSERTQRLIDQLELQLEELAAAASEDVAKAEATRVHVQSFTRRPATRRDFPADLSRRRIVHPAPTSCPCCGGSKLSKIGEDVTKTLDVVHRQWSVTEHVREKFSCRSGETITQAPAPFHAIARGFAGPSLLAMMLVEKYANHQPLNRQSEQYAREGIELSVLTMADHVGACAATLTPLYELIRTHVFAAVRIHGDDTTVPGLAKVKTRTGRIWTYVRDDRPFGGDAPPAAVFFYTPDRAGIHPERHLAGYSGILQADAYAGFNRLYEPDRKPGPITEAGCWAHARRKFFELADIAAKSRSRKPTTISPTAFEAVQKFDAVFMLERSIIGLSPEARVAVRRRDIAPLVNDLFGWMKRERGKLSRHNEVTKAFDYMLKRVDVFTRFLGDGRICLSNNATERELRGIALGRRSWLFAGSDRGGERAAVMLTPIQTAKLNDVDPQAWLADVLARIADHKITDLAALLPWNWRRLVLVARAA